MGNHKITIAKPFILMMYGFPGVGKSAFAKQLAEELGVIAAGVGPADFLHVVTWLHAVTCHLVARPGVSFRIASKVLAALRSSISRRRAARRSAASAPVGSGEGGTRIRELSGPMNEGCSIIGAGALKKSSC